MQAQFTNIANSLSNTGAREQAIRGGHMAQANAQSQTVPLWMQQNPEMARAYRLQQMNKANDYQNASIQQSQSPEAQSKRYGQFLQMLMAGNQNAFDPFNKAASISFGTPKVQVQPGLLDYAAQFAGMAGGKGSVGMGKNQGVNSTMYDTPIGPQMPGGGNDGPGGGGDTGVPTSNPYAWMSSTNWG